ncbi:MAG: hypothetical protein EHM48_09790 [Planctomycetaceae bacterium]|nr:MAG: hypothetical protein EHM48_09790 [Planctomycetaceae bacterium]
MTLLAWTLFVNPMPLSTDAVLALLLPLCAAVAIIYKTIRAHDVRKIWSESLMLILYIISGLLVLGAGCWLVQEYWPH